MRKLMLLTSIVLLSAAWVVAQQTYGSQSSGHSSQSSSGMSKAGNHTEVEGCLSGSQGNYTLTDKSGNKYELTGNTSKLSEHVGHEIQVTGSETSPSASSSTAGGSQSSATARGASERTIDVTSFKHISSTCSSSR